MSSLVQDDQEVVAALALLDCAAAKNGTISESDVSGFLHKLSWICFLSLQYDCPVSFLCTLLTISFQTS